MADKDMFQCKPRQRKYGNMMRCAALPVFHRLPLSYMIALPLRSTTTARTMAHIQHIQAANGVPVDVRATPGI
ncbi:hypothetical protein [Serratia odorifera]|uniref:hypothetical protein n=1 Tax=Serratia odorifera TaxID=618 RepID=UPI001F544E3D|nr:hypothetical protein [Serratia odorifera]